MIRQQHARYVEEDFVAATSDLQKSPPGIERAERFVQRLKAINTEYAPAEVKRALAEYATTMDQAITTAKHGNGATQYNQAIAQKKQALIEAIKQGEEYKAFP